MSIFKSLHCWIASGQCKTSRFTWTAIWHSGAYIPVAYTYHINCTYGWCYIDTSYPWALSRGHWYINIFIFVNKIHFQDFLYIFILWYVIDMAFPSILSWCLALNCAVCRNPNFSPNARYLWILMVLHHFVSNDT